MVMINNQSGVFPRLLAVSTLTLMMLLLFGCESAPDDPWKDTGELQKFKWLAGSWQSKRGDKSSIESWQLAEGPSMAGIGMSIRDGDTTVVETMTLTEANGKIVFTADVRGNPAPVPFEMVEWDSSRAVFENTGHDFPQRIIYFPIDDDSLHVRIEGDQNGNLLHMTFGFTRKSP